MLNYTNPEMFEIQFISIAGGLATLLVMAEC